MKERTIQRKVFVFSSVYVPVIPVRSACFSRTVARFSVVMFSIYAINAEDMTELPLNQGILSSGKKKYFSKSQGKSEALSLVLLPQL